MTRRVLTTLLAAGALAAAFAAPAGAASAPFPLSMTQPNPCGGPALTATGTTVATISSALIGRNVTAASTATATGTTVTGTVTKWFFTFASGSYPYPVTMVLTWVTPTGTFKQNMPLTITGTLLTPTAVTYGTRSLAVCTNPLPPV